MATFLLPRAYHWIVVVRPCATARIDRCTVVPRYRAHLVSAILYLVLPFHVNFRTGQEMASIFRTGPSIYGNITFLSKLCTDN